MEVIVVILFPQQIFIQLIKINGSNKLILKVLEVIILHYYIKVALLLHLEVWECMMLVENVVDALTQSIYLIYQLIQ